MKLPATVILLGTFSLYIVLKGEFGSYWKLATTRAAPSNPTAAGSGSATTPALPALPPLNPIGG